MAARTICANARRPARRLHPPEPHLLQPPNDIDMNGPAKAWHDDSILTPGPNGSKMEPLTVRRLFEILAMEFDETDFILKNGYLTKGESLDLAAPAESGSHGHPPDAHLHHHRQKVLGVADQRQRNQVATTSKRKHLPTAQRRSYCYVLHAHWGGKTACPLLSRDPHPREGR